MAMGAIADLFPSLGHRMASSDHPLTGTWSTAIELSVATGLSPVILTSAQCAPCPATKSATGSLPCATKGEAMSVWYPGWQLAAAWLLTVVVAATIYFVPVTRLVEIMITAQITADVDWDSANCQRGAAGRGVDRAMAKTPSEKNEQNYQTNSVSGVPGHTLILFFVIVEVEFVDLRGRRCAWRQ
jgi:hypothetical protein